MRIEPVFALGLSAVLMLGGAACSSSDPVVAKADLEKQVSSQLGKTAGHEPQSVVCPSDLTAKVGSNLKCQLTDAGQSYGVNVTVTSVNGTDVKFDIKVDDKPSSGSGSSSSASSSAASSTQDYGSLLIKASDIVAPGDTFTAQAPTLNPNGKDGVATVFSNAGDTREIGDTILVLPDAAGAATALQGAVSALGSSVTGGTPQKVQIGSDATLIAGTSPDGAKAVTVLVFTEGKAFTTLEFDSASADPVPTEFVTDVGQKQDAAIKSGLG
jgi:hypothetical protein